MKERRFIIIVMGLRLLLFTLNANSTMLLSVSQKMRQLRIESTYVSCIHQKSYEPIFTFYEESDNYDGKTVRKTLLECYTATTGIRLKKNFIKNTDKMPEFREDVIENWANMEKSKIVADNGSSMGENESLKETKSEKYSQKAEQAFERGNYGRAAKLFKKTYKETSYSIDLYNAGISQYNNGKFKRAYKTMTEVLGDRNNGLSDDEKETAKEVRDNAYDAYWAKRREIGNAIAAVLQQTTQYGYNSYGGMRYMAPPNVYNYLNNNQVTWNNSYTDNMFRQAGIPTPEEYMNGARFNHQISPALMGTSQGAALMRSINNNELVRQRFEEWDRMNRDNMDKINQLVAKNYQEWHDTYVAINGHEPSGVEIDLFYYNAYNPGSSVASTNSNVGESKGQSLSSGSYQSDYEYYAEVAEMYYNSATLGNNTVNSSGHYDGSTSSAYSGSYAGSNAASTFKSQFRIAQNKMVEIRREAAAHGMTINQSKWETAVLK